MVFPLLGTEPVRPLRTRPPRRLPVRNRRPCGPSRASGRQRRPPLRRRLDRRTVAPTLARHPDRIRPTTRLHYTRSVELVLIPYLGHYRLADLDGPLLRAVFAEIAKTTNSKGKPQSASALHHLRTTLRAALNLAVREELIESNPA